MKAFLEQYGTAIFTLVIIAILVAFAGPVGKLIKNNINEQINTIDELGTNEINKKDDNEVVLQKVSMELTESTTYNGSKQFGYSSINGLDVNGDYSATDAGTYTFTVTPQDGYCWDDNTVETKTYTWTINRQKTANVETRNLIYTGTSQSGIIASNVKITGDRSGTESGKYTCTATPDKNYAWSDGTFDSKTYTWKIVQTNILWDIPYTNTETSSPNGDMTYSSKITFTKTTMTINTTITMTGQPEQSYSEFKQVRYIVNDDNTVTVKDLYSSTEYGTFTENTTKFMTTYTPGSPFIVQ